MEKDTEGRRNWSWIWSWSWPRQLNVDRGTVRTWVGTLQQIIEGKKVINKQTVIKIDLERFMLRIYLYRRSFNQGMVDPRWANAMAETANCRALSAARPVVFAFG